MPPKERKPAIIFLTSVVLTLVSTGYNLAVTMEAHPTIASSLGWGAVILGCVLGSLISAMLWCACRQSVVRAEVETLEIPAKALDGASGK